MADPLQFSRAFITREAFLERRSIWRGGRVRVDEERVRRGGFLDKVDLEGAVVVAVFVGSVIGETATGVVVVVAGWTTGAGVARVSLALAETSLFFLNSSPFLILLFMRTMSATSGDAADSRILDFMSDVCALDEGELRRVSRKEGVYAKGCCEVDGDSEGTIGCRINVSMIYYIKIEEGLTCSRRS